MTFTHRVNQFASEGFGLTPQSIAQVMNQVYCRANRLILCFILGHNVLAILQAISYRTWAITVPVTLAVDVMFVSCMLLVPESYLTRMVAGLSLQILVALHIYQLHGLAEMHFYFFTAQTMMIIYEDWLATWPGTISIIAQHVLFAFLQNSGTNIPFFPDSYITATKLTFHFGIALVQTILCCYWAVLSRRSRLYAEAQRLKIAESHSRMEEALHHSQQAELALSRHATELEAARAKAENAAHAQSTFIANTSHELRTPMNGILGMTELLLQSPLNTDQRECADLIKDSSNALLTILNDVLDLSKIESGCLSLELIPVRLADFVEQIASLFAPKADDKGIELVVRIDPAAPEVVRADPTRLRQVLLNLLGNAVKFTSKGTVQLRVELFSMDNSHCQLRFSVADTGIGIPADKLVAIFDRFAQADGSTTRNFGGTGLGLTISKNLVELMNSRLEVESQSGVGSTFAFTLTLPVKSSSKESTPDRSTTLEKIQVLLVCPRDLTRLVLHEMIASWGAQVCSVGQISDVTGSQRWDVVVEHCEGKAVSREEQDGRFRNTPVISLATCGERFSGHSEFCRVLSLPVQSGKLLEALKDAVSLQKDQIADSSHRETARLKASENPTAHILLAEDNTVNQRVARSMLAKLGYQVDLATNGKEAVEKWSTGTYQLILMDCHMPEMDGFEATSRIRQMEADLKKERIPIIAVTASAMPADREYCFRLGMDEFVSKPVTTASLQAAIEKCMLEPVQ